MLCCCRKREHTSHREEQRHRHRYRPYEIPLFEPELFPFSDPIPVRGAIPRLSDPVPLVEKSRPRPRPLPTSYGRSSSCPLISLDPPVINNAALVFDPPIVIDPPLPVTRPIPIACPVPVDHPIRVDPPPILTQYHPPPLYFHPPPMPLGGRMREDLFRSAESEGVIRDVLLRILYNDPLSRDEDRRRGGLMAAAVFGGIGSRDDFRLEDAVLKEDIRRVNIAAQIANNSVQLHMVSAEVHPKMTPDGRYPREFDLPKRLEQVLSADATTLDRLLSAYDLRPAYLSSLSRNRGLSPLSTGLSSLSLSLSSSVIDDSREAKLRVLLEYLGVQIDTRDSGGLGGRLGGLGSWERERERDRNREKDRDRDRLRLGGRGLLSGI